MPLKDWEHLLVDFLLDVGDVGLFCLIHLIGQLLLAVDVDILVFDIILGNLLEYIFQLLPECILCDLGQHGVTLLQVHGESILYPIEVEPVQHAAYALHYYLLLAD